MCLGGSTQVNVPKPAPLPPPIPAPPPPKPPGPPPAPLQKQGQVPDIRVGKAKRQPTNRRTGTGAPGKRSLSIGNNQGLNI